MSGVADTILALAARVSALEQRLARSQRPGVVDSVDPARRRCRIKLADDGGRAFLSPWVPYAQIAGALKVHTPPSEGQQMWLMAAGGDLTQALAVPYTWSDAEPAPSEAADPVLTFGNWRISLTADVLAVALGGTEVFRLTADEALLKAPDVTLDGDTTSTGEFTAPDAVLDDKRFSTHTHGEVQPGGGVSGPPS